MVIQKEKIYGREKDNKDVAISVVSVLPIGKAFTVTKEFRVTENTTKGGVNAVEQIAVHGNSLKRLKPKWGYKLYSADGTSLNNCITSKLIPETRYTKAFMLDKKMIPFKQFPNRLEAYQ